MDALPSGQPEWATPPETNLIWAVTTFQQQQPAVWAAAFLAAVEQQLHSCGPQGLANTAWALATLRIQPPSELQQQLLARRPRRC